MALSKTLTKTVNGFSGDLVAENVYFKVSKINGDKTLLSVTVTGASSGLLIYNQEFSFEPDLEGPNFIKQAYNHLKALPEFSGATDC